MGQSLIKASEQYLTSHTRRYQIAPIKKPALLRGRVLRNSNTSSSAPALDSHQRLSDVADNTVAEAQVISSYANQVDYSSIVGASNGTSGISNSSSGTNSVGLDNNLSTGSAFNEEHFQSGCIASRQSARVEGVARTQNDAVASAECSCSTADSEIVGSNDFSWEVEHVLCSGGVSCGGQCRDYRLTSVGSVESVNRCSSIGRSFVQGSVLINNSLDGSNGSIAISSGFNSCSFGCQSGSSVSVILTFMLNSSCAIAVDFSYFSSGGNYQSVSFGNGQFFFSRSNQCCAESRNFRDFSNQCCVLSYRQFSAFQCSVKRSCTVDSWGIGSWGEGRVQRCVGNSSASSFNQGVNTCLGASLSSSVSSYLSWCQYQCSFGSHSCVKVIDSFNCSSASVVGGGGGASNSQSSSLGSRCSSSSISLQSSQKRGAFSAYRSSISCVDCIGTSSSSQTKGCSCFSRSYRTVFTCCQVGFNGIQSWAGYSGSFSESIDSGVGINNSGNQAYTWNGASQSAVGDCCQSCVNRSSSTVHWIDDSFSSSSVEAGTSSVSANAPLLKPSKSEALSASAKNCLRIPPPSPSAPPGKSALQNLIPQPLRADAPAYLEIVPPVLLLAGYAAAFSPIVWHSQHGGAQ